MSAEHAHAVPTDPGAPAAKSEEIAKRLLARRATLKADAEYIAEELDRIDGQLLEWTGGKVGRHELGGSIVEVKEYSRTDYAAVAAAYPADQYPALYETKTAIDQAAVKKQFAPAALDAFKVTGKKSVVVK